MRDIRSAPLSADALGGRLRLLSYGAQAAFVASCGERVVSVFDAFARQSNCDGVDAVRKGVDLVWNAAIGEPIQEGALRVNERAVRATMPDHEKIYRSPFTTIASDAVQIVLNGLGIAGAADNKTASASYAIDAGIICQSIVEMYLGLVNLPDYHDMNVRRLSELNRIDFTKMPMFIAELEKQEADIQLLETTPEVGAEVVRTLKETGFLGLSPVTRFML